MSSVVTMPKQKYETLEDKARAYDDLIKAIARGGFFEVPTIRKSRDILNAFRASQLYNDKFLNSLSRGLKRSSYFM